MLPPGLLAVVLVTALLALVPARRLFLGGQSAAVIGGYFLILWVLGLLVAVGPGRSRLVVPLLLVLYLVPFITWRAGLERLLGRRFGADAGTTRPPPRNVTPPSEAERPSGSRG